MTDKEKIENLLRNYPFMVSNVAVEMAVDPVSGVNYNKIPTQKSNEFYSTVEEYIIDKEEVSDKIIETLNKIRAIDSVMEIVLTEQQRKFISEYYWQNKTMEKLADGNYGVYSTKGIRGYRKKICKKLSRGGLLEVV